MKSGRLLAFLIFLATVILIAMGTLWPSQTAIAMAASTPKFLRSFSSPQAAADDLLREIGRRDFPSAYSDLANKADFSEPDFVHDLTGSHGSLRTYAVLDSFDLKPLHASPTETLLRANIRWASVVGTFQDVRDLRVIKSGDRWKVVWPLVREARVPPQVIPVNYLRWDVIYRGPEDDWGAQDVEAPHVRIVAMHPVERNGTVSILGELLNEDVVPAFVSVKATLLGKDEAPITTEDSFDRICHVLLPKQVSPFRIDFRNAKRSQVGSVRMEPSSLLIPASADPVIEIQGQHLNAAPRSSLTGQVVNQSGQVVNVAHVLATFYGPGGQILWVSDQYLDRALSPQTPVAFSVSFPQELAGKITSYRVITSPYSSERFQ